MANNIENKLIELGGNLWEGSSHRRIYINNWLELAGFEITRYKTGNISSASLNNEKVSNAKAAELNNVKCFWDCNAEKLVLQGRARMLDEARDALETALGITP